MGCVLEAGVSGGGTQPFQLRPISVDRFVLQVQSEMPCYCKWAVEDGVSVHDIGECYKERQCPSCRAKAQLAAFSGPVI